MQRGPLKKLELVAMEDGMEFKAFKFKERQEAKKFLLHLSLGSGFLFSLVILSCRKHSDLAFKEPVGPERVRSVSLFISFLTAAQGVGVLVAGHFTLCSISLVTRVSSWPIENKSLSLSPCSIPLI